MHYVSDKVEEWVKEKGVLLAQINDLRARYDLKCDEIEQYNHLLCLERRTRGRGWKRKAMKTDQPSSSGYI